MRNNPRKQGVLLSLSRLLRPGLGAGNVCAHHEDTKKTPFIGSYNLFAFKVLKFLIPKSGAIQQS